MRIVIIQGHPDPAPERFCRALADAYAQGARDAGHQVGQIDLATTEVPMLRTAVEFQSRAIPASLADAKAELAGADHVVLIFPLWLGTMPALVKAFLEQIMRPDTDIVTDKKAELPMSRFKGKSAHVIVTMGMPASLYRYFFFSHGVAGLRRNILRFVGFGPVRETLFGLVENVSDAKRQNWLDRMHSMGERGA